MSKTLFDKREIMGRWVGKDMVKYPEEDVKEFIKKRLKDLADVNSGKLHPMVAFNRLRHEAGKGLTEEEE